MLAAITLPERYRVVRHLARGGMATVWEAEDEVLARRVAVKLLAEHLAQDVGARERFQREGRAAAKVSDHAHVVTIYDVGECDGRPFIVMELMPGGTVAARIHEARPSHEQALDWLRQAADALDDTHARGLVHRDIKPGNLLLDEGGRLAVTDFGIARLAHEQTLTATGQVLGTAAYLSPEQARGDPATPASDRYALAVVAFQLLTGRRPFTAEHFAAQARQHLEAAPPPASSIRPELPAGVDAALGRGLAKEPARRWPTARALVDALERALDQPDVPPPDAFPAPPPRRRWSRLAPTAAVLAVAALAGGLIVGSGGDKVTAHVDHETNHRVVAAKRDARRAKRDETEAKAAATQSPTPDARTRTPTNAQSPTANAQPTGAPPSDDDPSALNNQGYALLQSGHPDQAVPLLRKAVDACHGDPSQLACAYAMYNLAQALRQTGHADEAVPLLEKRLHNPDQKDKVKKELEKAKGRD
jgi:eukaryotic-like serine/threonine-protein kinase